MLRLRGHKERRFVKNCTARSLPFNAIAGALYCYAREVASRRCLRGACCANNHIISGIVPSLHIRLPGREGVAKTQRPSSAYADHVVVSVTVQVEVYGDGHLLAGCVIVAVFVTVALFV